MSPIARGPRAFLSRFLVASSAICLSSLCGPLASAKEVAPPEPIVIGQSAPFSGPSSQLGNDFNLGARTYFQMVNDSGGVNGRRIELRVKDDAYDPERTAKNTAELIEQDRVVALFGYVGTTTTLAAVPLASAAGVALFAPVSGAEAFRRPLNRHVFTLRAGYREESEYITGQLSTSGVNGIAVFYQDDAYGKAGLEAMSAAAAKHNIRMLATAAVPRHSTEVTAAAKALVDAKPHTIALISSYGSSAALIKEMRKDGFPGQFVSLSFVGGKPLADALGNDGSGVIISEVVPFPWSEATPIQREYVHAMQKAGVPGLGFGSMEGFLAAKTLVEGLRRAGRDVTRAKLIAALETMNQWDAGGFRISFSPTDHTGSHFVEMTMIGLAGKFVH